MNLEIHHQRKVEIAKGNGKKADKKTKTIKENEGMEMEKKKSIQRKWAQMTRSYRLPTEWEVPELNLTVGRRR